MAKSKWIDDTSKIRFTQEELETLADLAQNTVYFPILIRFYHRLLSYWKDQSFKLNETNPNFTREHQRLVENAAGIRLFLRFIKNAPVKLEKENNETSDKK